MRSRRPAGLHEVSDVTGVMSDRLRTVAWRAAAMLPLWFTGAFIVNGSVDPSVRVMVAAVGILSLVNPVQGLLLLAIAAPLGDLVAILFEAGPVRLTEAAAMAFLAGWLLRGPAARHRGPTPAGAIKYGAAVLASMAVVSVIVQVLVVRARFPNTWDLLWSELWYQYYLPSLDMFGGLAALRWLEGLALAAAVVMLCRRAPVLAVRLPEALAAGCVVAAVSAVLLWGGIGLPAIVARQARLAPRVVAHISDVNAAGSYFGLMLCLACGMAARERGRRGMGWLAVGLSAMMGLWLSRSRSAEGATLLVILPAIPWVLTRRWSPRVRYATAGGLLAALVVAGVIGGQVRDPSDKGALFRWLFTQTSYRMILARPWFGAGVGQYYPLSPLFLSPQLAYTYGAENAHNYFLQTAAELGVIGLGICLIAMTGIARCAARALAATPRDFRLLGLTAGVLAFLLTCLTGHPLLVLETAYPFWLALGLLVALSSPVGPYGSPPAVRWPRVALAASVAALALSIPFRARQGLPGIKPAPDVEGLRAWETGADGKRYRSSENYASVFVEAGASHVDIPMRAPGQDYVVSLVIDKRPVQRFAVGDNWSTLAIDLPMPTLTTRYWRINFKSERVQPANGPDPVGADGRSPGVQVGATSVR